MNVTTRFPFSSARKWQPFYLAVLSALLLLPVSLTAQYTIAGRVIDADTDEGIPFCNVYYAGSTLGVSTDIDGYYELAVAELRDTLTASAIGYETSNKLLNKESVQEINFRLENALTTLDEIVVRAGENPANAIVRSIIEHKPDHQLDERPAYQYESYAKVEIDLEEIPERLQNRKVMEPFAFVFESIDSTSDEKPFLPIYLNETLKEVYYSTEVGRKVELIKAQRASGTDNASFIEFVKLLHPPFDVYENWINLIDKPFVSPFSDRGLAYYEYYIIDSAWVEGQWSYKLKFKPRRKQEATFFGDFWVADTTFAVQRLNARMSPDANLNLVSRVILYQEFDYSNNQWLPAKQKMVVDFAASEKAPGMIARRTETYRNYRLDAAQIQLNFPEKVKGGEPPPFINDEAYWQTLRHEQLSETESGVYALVDSIQNVPAFKRYGQFFSTVFGGYFDLGKFQVGQYYSVYSRNQVEGNRLRLGLRSDDDLSENLRLSGYLAYGFGDEKWKYGTEVKWLLDRYPWAIVGAGHRRDISLSSENSEDFQEGNLASNAFRRDVYLKLIDIEESKLYYERYFNNGLSSRVTLLNRRMDPFGDGGAGGFNYAFLKPGGEAVDTTINTTEAIVKIRYAPQEKFFGEGINRVSSGTTKPILEAQYVYGIQDLFGSDYSYHKFSLGINHWFNTSPAGWLTYRAEVGTALGRIPFLLQQVHPGNEAIFMSRSVFNTMNNYEFASDTYASLFVEQHFGGFFFDHIPLLRKLKLRELLLFKAVIGKMSAENRAANQLNTFVPQEDAGRYSGFRSPTARPFLEAGVGIENILSVIRVDALWRLNYLDNPEASRFSLVVGAYFKF